MTVLTELMNIRSAIAELEEKIDLLIDIQYFGTTKNRNRKLLSHIQARD